MTAITIICGISILLNCFSIWYIKGILTKLLFVSENQVGLSDALNSFSNHLNTVYELETFYGDETLSALIDHMKEVIEVIEEYEEIYMLTQEEPDGDEYDDDDKEED